MLGVSGVFWLSRLNTIFIISSLSISMCYVINVNVNSFPGTVLFNASLNSLDTDRRYIFSPSQNARFVYDLFHLNVNSGKIVLKRYLNCKGFHYPRIFSLYIDSVPIRLRNINYFRLSLRMQITGSDCNDDQMEAIYLKMKKSHLKNFELGWFLGSEFANLRLKNQSMSAFSQSLFRINQWSSQTFASFAIYVNHVNKVCFEKYQFVSNLLQFLPQTVSDFCVIKHTAISDFPLELNFENHDIIAARRVCISEPLFKVLITINLQCEKKIGMNINHQIGIIYYQKMLNNSDLTPRVRRELTNRSPYFNQNLYIGSILEESIPGEVVITVQAYDPENSPILYQMTSILDSRSQSLFAIDSHSGVVTTSASLDREQMRVHYFQIIASDASFLPRSGTTTLQIIVEDSNDNYPVFENENLNATIWEGSPIGTPVMTIRATDHDIGKNAEIEYIIEYINNLGLISKEKDTKEFSVDSKTGILSTNIILDREETDLYTIFLVARDSPEITYERKSTTATILVKVLDENDNFPQFNERIYSIQIKENEISNNVIAHIKATDADEGNNAAIRYAIISGNIQTHFSIDSMSGEVTLVKPLDYEIIQNFRIIIRAQDGGSPSRSNTTQLLVQVLDVNDNPPKFYVTHFQESVLENIPMGYNVIRVQAYDPDHDLNAEIRYSLKDSDEYFPFIVGENTGWIQTKRQLDREECSRYVFQVVATDQGTPSMSASANVIVVVQDVNDNDPSFSTKYYEVAVREDLPPGSSILTVSATDPDENSRLHYDIISGNVRSRFAINIQNGNGIITVAQPLDFKQESRFLLTVTVTDLGGRLDTAYININVTDINNFAPVFENSPYSTLVMEDIPIGTTVLIVSAIDNDAGINAQITYTLEGPSNDNIRKYPFAVHPKTGAIITTNNLDREDTPAYILTVKAIDAGIPNLSDTTDVEIILSDVNDNRPEFNSSVYHTTISEDVAVGTFVIQVFAKDIDSGSNGQLTYALDEKNNTDGSFIIDSASGTIRTNKLLDRESRSEYRVVVIAKDKGIPPQSSFAHIYIKLEDINDSAPSFSADKIVMYVQENSPIGSTVGTIEAEDPDEGINAIIEYSIVGGIDANLFTLAHNIGSNSANIITMTQIDYESAKKKFEVIVRAASPPLRNDVYIEILIIDVNDNVPVLKDFKIIFNNFPDHFPIGEIGRIPVFDADVSDKLEYKIFSGNKANFVIVNASTGGITLSPQLNTNVPRNAFMGVYVTDGINQITATMHLIVRFITEKILLNSVTIRLSEITEIAFLSPLLDAFIDSLAVVVPCPKENIIIFSILEDYDTVDTVLNVSFSALVPNIQKDNFFSVDYLQERIHIHRTTLNLLSGIEIIPFEDDLCVREPCLNFEQCAIVLKYGNASSFTMSDTILFRSIHPVKNFACYCPPGFTGSKEYYLCDTELDMCYSNPCQSNANCYQLEGGFTCSCRKGIAAQNCEKINDDLNLCFNDGCETELSCFLFDKAGENKSMSLHKNCGLASRSFTRSSFLILRGIKSRYRFSIKLKFATLEANGLLFYNGRYNEMYDFIGLAIVDGHVTFTFSLGSAKQTVTVRNKGSVSDGMWHTVELTYFNRTATIAIDDCDKILGLKLILKRNWSCVNQTSLLLPAECSSSTAPCYRFLDLTGPLQLGGLSKYSKNFPFKASGFSGCISELIIDNQFVNMNSYLSENGTMEGCSQKTPHCKSELCLNGGVCIEGWNRPLCNCAEGYTGHVCQEITSPPWRFSKSSILTFNPLLRPIQFPWSFGLSIRTLQENSFLIQIQIGQNNSIILFLENGMLHLFYESDYVHFTTISLSDGIWHRVDVHCIKSYIKISIDYDQRSSFHTFHKSIQGKYIGKVRLGVVDYTIVNSGYFQNYNGCIKDVRIDGVQSVNNLPSVIENLEDGCESKAECPKLCPLNSICIKKWDEAFCECQVGYIGSNCIPVCKLNPCHSGICEIDFKLSKSYRCECNGTSYFGEHCEHSAQIDCPPGWWGDKICGPCLCDIYKGYSPDCDKSTGQCYCKESHFQPINHNVCLPCNCYALGSLASTCDSNTGQCICKAGVVGRRCDFCTNPYAEVTSSGCEVVYDACPRSYSDGIWWKRTILGKIDLQNCPDTAKGKASRVCDETTGKWSDANLFNCTSKAFIDLKKKVELIETRQLVLNSFLSITLVNNLRKACETVSESKIQYSHFSDDTELLNLKLYGMDILVAQRLLHYIIKFESTMHGLNLSHSQDKNFVENIIFIANVVLNKIYAPIWIVISKNYFRTPKDLINLIDEYMNILGESQHETFTSPFEVVTENIAFGLDIISINSSLASHAESIRTTSLLENNNMHHSNGSPLKINLDFFISVPKYNNYLEDTKKFDKYSKAYLPISLLDVQNVSKILPKPFDHRIVVTYSQYKSTSILFPERYDETISSQWGVHNHIGSNIFSLQILKPFLQNQSPSSEKKTEIPLVSHGKATPNQHNKKSHISIDDVLKSKYNHTHLLGKWNKTNSLEDMSMFVYRSFESEMFHNPISLQMYINISESKFTSKINPQCVRWNKVSNCWTRIGCQTEPFVYTKQYEGNYTYINCTCNLGSTYAVLVDSIETDIFETSLKKEYAIRSSFIFSLFLHAIVFLALWFLKGPRTNSMNIRLNTILSTFCAKLFFIMAINNQEILINKAFLCKFLAVAMHYSWLSAFIWMMLDCFHLYRMFTEMRDVNNGPMKFYSTVGFGGPPIILCIAVGLRSHKYGQNFLCWLSLHEPLVRWLFGPICATSGCSLLFLFMSIKSAFTLKEDILEYGNLRILLLQCVILLPLMNLTWVLSMLSISKTSEVLVKSLCSVVFLHSVVILIANCIINKQTRNNLYLSYFQYLRKRVPVVESSQMNRSAVIKSNITKSVHSNQLKHNIGISTASTTSRSTGQTHSSLHRSDDNLSFASTKAPKYIFAQRNFRQESINLKPHENDMYKQAESIQSNSGIEIRILDLASSHSSDDEEPKLCQNMFKQDVIDKEVREILVAEYNGNIESSQSFEKITCHDNAIKDSADSSILPLDAIKKSQNHIHKLLCNVHSGQINNFQKLNETGDVGRTNETCLSISPQHSFKKISNHTQVEPTDEMLRHILARNTDTTFDMASNVGYCFPYTAEEDHSHSGLFPAPHNPLG